MFDTLGPECLNDPDGCSKFIQDNCVALIAKGAKGRGKGKGKYPVRPSNLSIEDRRKKLVKLKSETECKDCGRKGHWKGDKECTMQKQQRSSYLAVDSRSSQPTAAAAASADDQGFWGYSRTTRDNRLVFSFDSEEEHDDEHSDFEHAGFMAVKSALPVPGKYRQPVPEEPKMEWAFAEGEVPPGGDQLSLIHI